MASKILAVRVPPELHTKFQSLCKRKLRRPMPEVVREIIAAAVEGRVTIKPTEGQLALFKTKE